MKNIFALSSTFLLDKKRLEAFFADETSAQVLVPTSLLEYYERKASQGVSSAQVFLEHFKLLQKNTSITLLSESIHLSSEILDSSLRLSYSQVKEKPIVLCSSSEEELVYSRADIKTKIYEVLEEHKNPLEQFFDGETMSVHIKEGQPILRKKGTPGTLVFETTEMVLSHEQTAKLVSQCVEFAQTNKNSYIEKDSKDVLIVQLENIRTVLVKPPVSERFEITAVRPVTYKTFEDYPFSDELKVYLETKAEGILICGAPGSGKSTFAQAYAEKLANKGKIVKTLESPRDLVVSPKITQLSLNNTSTEDIAHILLLSRPDYTIYDEMRTPKDMVLYADLRLAGIGMVGVIHATKPIDSIHRLIGKLELGTIPQVVDTVLFFTKGQLQKVFVVFSTVKTPAGMTEADLARPVIQIKDFTSKQVEYELYTYGEETVVMDLTKIKPREESSLKKHAKESVAKVLKTKGISQFSIEFESDDRIILKVPDDDRAEIIGQGGKRIAQLEKEVGLKITLASLSNSEKQTQELHEIFYTVERAKNYILFSFNEPVEYIEISTADGELISSNAVGKRNQLKLKRSAPQGKLLDTLIARGEPLQIVGK